MDQASETCLMIQFQIVSDEESQNIYFKVSLIQPHSDTPSLLTSSLSNWFTLLVPKTNHNFITSLHSQRDGQRFGQEYTLKLKSETKYRCTITIKPSIPLQ